MKVRFNVPPTVADAHNGLTVRYAAAKRQLPRLRWYLLLLLVSVPLVYLAFGILAGLVWDSSPGFVAMPQTTLRASMGGRLELLVHEGDAVPAGAVVARVHAQDLTAPPVSQADGATQASRLALVDSAYRQDAQAAQLRLGHSGAVLRLAQAQQTRMAERLDVVNRLIGEGAATAAERAQAEAQLNAAQSDVLRAQADLAGADSARQRAGLERLRARQAGVALPPPGPAPQPVGEVLAPVAGTVVRSLALSQDWVVQGTELLVLQAQAEPEIRVYINPAKQHNARLGEAADLRFLDGDTLSAVVVKIEAETARTPPERVGPLASRMQSIVAVLKPDQPLPSKYRIGDLPLDVRFHRFGW